MFAAEQYRAECSIALARLATIVGKPLRIIRKLVKSSLESLTFPHTVGACVILSKALRKGVA
jgi:hypothetical protein